MSLNKQGPRKIDWCDYTWNPISGCLHGCDYCYMRRMEKRFPGIMEPTFHLGRLADPLNLKEPSRIFVGSSGDMWGEWVDEEWIDDVLDVCEVFAPQHTYQFLTKNPIRYAHFDLPKNGWYGTTLDGSERTKDNYIDLIFSVDVKRRFISFEPLLAGVDLNLAGIQWVIIGANSNRGAPKPPDEWADRIIEIARECGGAVWVKDNYQYHLRIKEFPKNYQGKPA